MKCSDVSLEMNGKSTLPNRLLECQFDSFNTHIRYPGECVAEHAARSEYRKSFPAPTVPSKSLHPIKHIAHEANDPVPRQACTLAIPIDLRCNLEGFRGANRREVMWGGAPERRRRLHNPLYLIQARPLECRPRNAISYLLFTCARSGGSKHTPRRSCESSFRLEQPAEPEALCSRRNRKLRSRGSS